MGLLIINIANPSAPTLTGSYSYGPNTNTTSVALAGNYAYVTDVLYNRMFIINVSNPAVPTLSSVYNTAGWAADVAVSGNYAHVVTWGPHAVEIVNIANPASPIKASSYPYAGAKGVRAIGSYSYVAAGDSFRVVNVANPVAPTLVGTFSPLDNTWDMTINGNYAYTTEETGLSIINISNPAAPNRVGFYKSTNQSPNVPASPNPTHNAAGIAVTANISWTGSDPDNDSLTYEVRFGTTNPPPQVVASQSASNYNPPGDLANNTTYYWQIVARDIYGFKTSGPVWSFTTAGSGPTFPDVFYVSPDKSGTLSGIDYTGSDILKYTKSTNTWTMFFDGSDVGVTKNVSAFAFLPGGDNILLSFSANQALGSLGTFAAQDVARFDPTSTGEATAGTFAWYFDGSDVGLSTAAEKIDALDTLDNGRLLISTTGAAAVPGLAKQQDEDVLAFMPTATGQTTAGTWSGFFDGTPVPGLKGEDVNCFWVDEPTGDRYLTIVGAFNLGGVAGNGKSIVKLPAGSNTPVLVPWTNPPFNVDGLELMR